MFQISMYNNFLWSPEWATRSPSAFYISQSLDGHRPCPQIAVSNEGIFLSADSNSEVWAPPVHLGHSRRGTDICLVLISWFPPKGFSGSDSAIVPPLVSYRRRPALGLCLQGCQPIGTIVMHALMTSLPWYFTSEHLQACKVGG